MFRINLKSDDVDPEEALKKSNEINNKTIYNALHKFPLAETALREKGLSAQELM